MTGTNENVRAARARRPDLLSANDQPQGVVRQFGQVHARLRALERSPAGGRGPRPRTTNSLSGYRLLGTASVGFTLSTTWTDLDEVSVVVGSGVGPTTQSDRVPGVATVPALVKIDAYVLFDDVKGLSAGLARAAIQVLRDGVQILSTYINGRYDASDDVILSPHISTIDRPTPGRHTYSLQVNTTGFATNPAQASAYELTVSEFVQTALPAER